MNTQHLKYALEVERTHSITKASENLFMSQPNLSKVIGDLEESLGITIFKRVPGGVRPTEQGKKFLEYAKRVIAQIDKMEAIRISMDDDSHFIRMSVSRDICLESAYVRCMSDFTARHTNMQINVSQCDAENCLLDASEDGCDIGIISYPAESELNILRSLDKIARKRTLLYTRSLMLTHASDSGAADGDMLSLHSSGYTELRLTDAVRSDTPARMNAARRAEVKSDVSGMNTISTNCVLLLLRTLASDGNFYSWLPELSAELLTPLGVSQTTRDGRLLKTVIFRSGNVYSSSADALYSEICGAFGASEEDGGASEEDGGASETEIGQPPATP